MDRKETVWADIGGMKRAVPLGDARRHPDGRLGRAAGVCVQGEAPRLRGSPALGRGFQREVRLWTAMRCVTAQPMHGISSTYVRNDS